ncbi:hypothetical protein GNE08_27035 (plasmid) [Trichormus variabilis ARAD]|nr:hypothetical protein [Trichormus variabilis ARAD]MBC1259158.1 hypothetical protein [Trichormus variabilis V5]MBC1270688.1 hypothetical protein [Trichormus variabilis FSR]MBC1305512.1 hypothetical protein [Trichormus variabilis N2B]MBC1314785.1 hypothetical protein [Trichormus variabilis PNB]MBC1329924.1 hypothetical protein [Trichormus variabilis 9RC]MBD2382718.1 hypothetical protein [Trichormus variabilis FACHB-319]QHD83704.1 hypothetical protein GSQ19_28035 [Trichormus variabilis 0441]
MAVGAVAGAFTAHAAGEKNRQEAKHHKQIANELTNKYASLAEQYYELADKNKKDVKKLTDQLALSEVEKDFLRLAVRLQQNLIFLMWEIDREPTVNALNSFQSAVEQTNQVLSQLQEELIIVPDDYYTRTLTAIEVTKEINLIIPSDTDSTNILSVDLGRAFTKACISREPSSVVFIPANVKHIPFEQIFTGAIYKYSSIPTDPLMNLWLEYKGSGYAVGQLGAKLGANLGVGQSKVEDALAKILAAIGYFKLKDEISVVISLPFLCSEQFEIEKTELISIIAGPHIMKFRGESVYFNITKVWVMPEGYGSLLWKEAQPKKRGDVPDFTKNSVAIIDIGYESTNIIMLNNFCFVKDASKSEYFGMNKLYELIASEIEGADSQSLALISAITKPKEERFYRPKGASKAINLDDFLPNLIECFSREICSRILAWLDEQEDWTMNRVTNLIITGGGGEIFWEDVQRLLKEARINAHLAAPSRQANALGQYIYGEARLRKFNS